jgi:hypothetical protein
MPRGFGREGIQRRKYEFAQSSDPSEIQSWDCGENWTECNEQTAFSVQSCSKTREAIVYHPGDLESMFWQIGECLATP